LRLGLHGNFVEQREVDEWAERRKEGGDVGPARAAREALPWQKAMRERGELDGEGVGVLNQVLGGPEVNGVNGH
jgi:carotenoid cleavage dioxygenase